MTSGLPAIASGLLGAGAIGGVAVGATFARRGWRGRAYRAYIAGGFVLAARDDPDPVGRALRLGFAGVELAVAVDAGWQLGCGGGALAPVAFEPLAQRVRATAHRYVYASRSEPFQLLLRLDTANPAAQPALDALLAEHADLLTRCIGEDVTPGAVTVVLTGPGWDRHHLDGSYERRAFLEGHVDAPCGSPSLVPLVYESLTKRLGWDAREPWRELPAEARHIVRSLVLQAHAEGRRLRFVDVPERPRAVRVAMWRELRAAGVDYLGSRHAAALARFLRGRLGGLRRARRHAAPRSRYTAAAHS
jgi:hypothetical protein